MSQYNHFYSIFENFLNSSEYLKHKELLEEQTKKTLNSIINTNKKHLENYEILREHFQEYNNYFIELNKSLSTVKNYSLSNHSEIQNHFNDYIKSITKTNLSFINKQIEQIKNINA